MSGAVLYAGIGAAVGAIIGGGSGFGLYQSRRTISKSKETPKEIEAPQEESTLPAKAISPAKAASSKKARHSVFETKTHYLTTNSEFYSPLDRFYTFLQFKEERAAFSRLIEHIDDLLGMEMMLMARNPVSKAAMPTIAQNLRNKAVQLMQDIIAFSKEQRPSPTKEKAMEAVRQDMTRTMDEIISDMHRTVAAEPMSSS